MRICIVVPYDFTQEGGVKRHAVHLAAELRRTGDEVWVLGSSWRTGDLGPNARGVSGIVKVLSNGGDSYVGIWTKPWEVYPFLRRHRFDVIHVHEPLVPTLPYYTIWLSPRTAHICTFHASYDVETARSKRARRFWSALSYPFFQRGIAVSTPAERFARYTWKKPLTIIPNGVPTTVYTPRPLETPEAVARRPVRLIFVGRWRDPRKGMSCLIDAYRRLIAAGHSLTLDVIGEGTDGPLPELPGLTFHGMVEGETELAERYRLADLFVAPATGQESFGIVLLEAMASGLPVICSDIEGYRQVIDEGGTRLVRPADAEALAAGIAEVARNPGAWAAMRAANLKRAAQFDWSIIARRVRAEYEAAIAAKRGGGS
ncbi:MAG: glycosyltransferase family 4 protein [Deltaproteobacteria bacterium]|nr:glycosyltransferase family 4 protein [Deltaproteobacteria bacterium]